ncbi:uncharacterized protein LOC133039240 [Cannabis sativa]|uniref:uncharacterized protein LOC133039240 n=1 Tax=Cannabis sativa TaxID=3483 RepID=UPI0029CA4DF3|nr:uncharacterized protein LOC133039240 [Cannabis sativa]
MVSDEHLAQVSMARPSTRSQDGIPPPTAEKTTSESNPDSTSAPVVNPSMAPRRPPTSRARPSQEEDPVEPDVFSPVQPAPQPAPSNRKPSLDRLAHEDVSSPFFLSTANHPGLVLVSTVLNGANYQSWKRGITMALNAKNKSAFIDGTLARLASGNPLLNSWNRCNNMVMCWLINSVSPEIAQSIMYFDLATDMWHDLQERFNEGNGPRIFQLQTQLTRLQQGDQSVTSYFTKLKSIWDELKEFQPNTTCSCGAMKIFLDYYNQNQVLQFLTGLNESYSSVRAQILLNEPIPNLSRVFAMIVQEERQRTLGSSSSDLSSMAASARPSSSTNPNRTKKSRPSCTNCGKPGHYVDKCYFLHGFPPGYGDKKKSEKGKTVANSFTAPPPPTETSHTTIDLTTQCQQLISLLSQQLSQGQTHEDPTTAVAASNMADFPSHVTLPNANRICAQGIGTVQINPHLIVYDAHSPNVVIGTAKRLGKVYVLLQDFIPIASSTCSLLSSNNGDQ